MSMADKLEPAAKVLKEVKLKAAKIREVESEPDFLPEEDLKKLETSLTRKIRAANWIQDQISDILGDPNFRSDEELKKLKEEDESVPLTCDRCRQVRLATQVWCCGIHIFCTTCYPTQIPCPKCGSYRNSEDSWLLFTLISLAATTCIHQR